MPTAAIIQPMIRVTKEEQAAQKAWAALKSSAKKDRGYWLDIGKGLADIRKNYPSNEQYGKRLKELGLDDIGAATRSDAVWMYENQGLWVPIVTIETVHPRNVRQEYREYEQRKRELEERAATEAEIEKAERLARIDAKKIKKYVAMAENEAAAPAEKAMAKAKIEKAAKDAGLSKEEVHEAVTAHELGEKWKRDFEAHRGAPMSEKNPAEYRRKKAIERIDSVLKDYINNQGKREEAVARIMKALEG